MIVSLDNYQDLVDVLDSLGRPYALIVGIDKATHCWTSEDLTTEDRNELADLLVNPPEDK